MLWATAIALITNSIQKRFPIFWLTASKCPDRGQDTPQSDFDDDSLSGQNSNTSALRDEGDFTNEKGLKECVTTISGVSTPSCLSLTTKHKKTLEEIRNLLGQNKSKASDVLEKKISFRGTRERDKWSEKQHE